MMWGQEWGEMIWGNPIVAAVPFAPWALIVLGMMLGICAIKAKDSVVARVIPIATIVLLPIVSVIAMNLPYEFTNGTVADADEVNANFQAIQDQILNEGSRYELKVTSNGVTPVRSGSIDHDAFTAMCGDDNGCVIGICTINPNSLNLSFCLRLRLSMIYRVSDGGYRMEDFDNNTSPGGYDGDGTVTTLHDSAYDCEFSDAEFTTVLGVGVDASPGFSLRNTSSTSGHICSIIFTD